MMALRMMAVRVWWVALVVLLCASTALAQSDASDFAVSLDPSLPLIDVEFLATPSVAQGTLLHVSLNRTSCDAITSTCVVGDASSAAYYSATTCKFTVTSSVVAGTAITSAPVPPLYWCARTSSGAWQTAPLTLNKVVLNPAYVYASQASAVLRFSEATPVGTRVLLNPDLSICPDDTTLYREVDESRTYAIGADARATAMWYVCASVPITQGGRTTYTDIRPISIVVANIRPYSIDATEAYSTGTVTISLTGTHDKHATLSTSSTCNSFAQPPQRASGTTLQLSVEVGYGEYYFCVESDGSGVFVPATGLFTVHEYALTPATMYAALPTFTNITLDGKDPGALKLEINVLTTDTCGAAASGSGWSAATQPWRTMTPGTYYVCVRQPDAAAGVALTTARAAVVTVYSPPTLTLGGTLLYGFDTRVELSGAVVAVGPLIVGVARDAACELLSRVTTTVSGRTRVDVTLPIPFDATGESPRWVLCVSTPVPTSATGPAPYLYSFLQPSIRHFNVYYPALLTNTQVSLTLDPTYTLDAGSILKLMPPSASCTDALSPNNEHCFPITTTTTSLPNVRFESAGAWRVCMHVPDSTVNCGTTTGAGFTQVAALEVYGDAVVTPQSALSALPSPVTVAQVPALAEVTVGTSATCPHTSPLQTAQANAAGVATMSVRAAGPTTLTVCVAYRGQTASGPAAAEYHAAGSITVVTPQLAAPAMVVAERQVRIRFDVPAGCQLAGRAAYLFDSTTTDCPDAPSGVPYAMIEADSNCTSTTPASARFSALSTGASYLTCIYVADNLAQHVAVGLLRVVAPMTMTSTPDPVVAGLPASFQFSGTSWQQLRPTSFVAVPTTTRCADFTLTDVINEGSVDPSTGRTTSFTLPADLTAVLLCVARPSNTTTTTTTPSYSYGGEVAVYSFTALTRYAQSGRTNLLQGWPAAGSDSLFLAPCSGTSCDTTSGDGPCQGTGPFYHTSATEALSGASPGTYLLCRSSVLEGAVVGANTTVTVVNPWTLTLNDGNLRRFVPATVTLQAPSLLRAPHYAESARAAQPLATAGEMQLCVQDRDRGCDAAALAGACLGEALPIRLGGNTLVVTNLTLPDNVTLCLQPGPYDSFEMLETTLAPYVSPGAIITDTATTLRVAVARTTPTQAKLSSSASCLDQVSSARVTVSSQTAILTLPNCNGFTNSLTRVYYCEMTTAAAAFEGRGVLTVLRRTACGSTPASIQPVTRAPGVTITDFGIDTAVLTRPSVSTSGTCDGDGLDAYAPRLGETAVLYVCAHARGDDAVMFTTSTPTLTVQNWQLQPTAALSATTGTGSMPQVNLTASPATPDSDTFLSTSVDCTLRTYPATGLATGSTRYATRGINGLLYVCIHVRAQSSLPFAIASFLSLTPPTVSRASPRVMWGTTLRATIAVYGAAGEAPLYSMQPGADATWPYSGFYVDRDRNVYLAVPGTACASALTSPTTVDATGAVAIETAGLAASYFAAGQSLALCTHTPAGVGEAAVLEVTPGAIYPTAFTAGSTGTIYVPRYRGTFMWIARSGDGCGATTITGPSFTTDADGYANVTWVSSTTSSPTTPGDYVVCYGDGATRTSLGTVTVFSVEHYDVRGTVYIVGVPATMLLQEDLTTSALVPGFSTSRDCVDVDTRFGAWNPSTTSTTNRAVVVTATSTASALYLCATALNHTRIALPHTDRTPLRFTTTVLFPDGATLDTCAAIDVAQCIAPDASTALVDATLEVVDGDCCAAIEDPMRVVVGSASMRTGRCSLSLNASRTVSDGDHLYSVCIRRSSDLTYCPTVSRVKISTRCEDDLVTGRSAMAGWLIAVIVISIVLGLLLLALLIYVLWRCCCATRKRDSGKLNGQLVALRQMEMGDEDEYNYSVDANGALTRHHVRSNSLASNRHPLLYYPRPSQEMQSGVHSQSVGLGRSTSQSQMLGSGANRYNTLLESIEDDERDQIALQEARERYHMRLHFNDELERLRVQAKEADLYSSAFAADDDEDVLATHVRPELKPVVEAIDLDPTDVTVQNATWQYDYDIRTPMSEERRRVGVHAIESSRPTTPVQRNSFRAGAAPRDEFAALSLDHDATAVPHDTSGPEANYTNIRKETSLSSSSSSVSQLVHMLNLTPSQAAATATETTREQRPRARFDTNIAQHAPGTLRPRDADDDVNELSYTTTQRFYDETRFFIEQEDIRRQRLNNWEEEERAQFAEAELAGYMAAISTQVLARNGDVAAKSTTRDASHSSSNESGSAVGAAVSHTRAGVTATDSSGSSGAGREVLYRAPHEPAQPLSSQRPKVHRRRASEAAR